MPEAADPMRERLQSRLDELRREHASGEAQLAALDSRRQELSTTLARITGAIHVLEETLAEA